MRRFANFILSDYILCTGCLLENRGITVLIKLGNCDNWIKEKFKVRSHDLMNDDIFISLPHVKRTMKNFWATVWKDFVIRMLFKIVLTKHSFDSANLPKRQDQLYWSETFYMKFFTWNSSIAVGQGTIRATNPWWSHGGTGLHTSSVKYHLNFQTISNRNILICWSVIP